MIRCDDKHICVQAVLSEILRDGAARLLAAALENEADEYVHAHAHLRNARGNRLVVRNGYLPARVIRTVLGPVRIHQPRVVHRCLAKKGRRIKFHSAILPPHTRRTQGMDRMVPWLYLRGMATGSLAPALRALLSPHAAELSSTNLADLTARWLQETERWERRSFHSSHCLKVLADAVSIHGSLVLASAREECILVLMAILDDDSKELIALKEGRHSSPEAWRLLFADAKSRGWAIPPSIVITSEVANACGPAIMEAYSQVFSRAPTTEMEHLEWQESGKGNRVRGQYKPIRPTSTKNDSEDLPQRAESKANKPVPVAHGGRRSKMR